jgi:hypothetical protein
MILYYVFYDCILYWGISYNVNINLGKNKGASESFIGGTGMRTKT